MLGASFCPSVSLWRALLTHVMLKKSMRSAKSKIRGFASIFERFSGGENHRFRKDRARFSEVELKLPVVQLQAMFILHLNYV